MASNERLLEGKNAQYLASSHMRLCNTRKYIHVSINPQRERNSLI